ncbi:MAG: ABC transporter substrate-binding protein [Defluviitaleaceae bacterium]|nr:ABC transporter substrate-binding protein [Defluviitaleaceae bacterium]
MMKKFESSVPKLCPKVLSKIVIAAAIFLVACDIIEQPGQLAPIAPNEVVYLLHSEPPTLDSAGANSPMTARIAMQIFEGLTSFDSDRNVVPNLAENFRMTSDGNWEFTLRQNIYFHDGEPFNAEAVRLNIERILNPISALPTAFMIDMIKDVVVIDDYTLLFITDSPFVPLPAHFTHFGTFMHSPAAIAQAQEQGITLIETPIGTGPFLFVSRNYGVDVRMKRNPYHWRTVPKIDYLTFLHIPEPGTRLLMMEAGNAHATLAMPANVAIVENNPDIDIHLIDTNTMNYIGFNTTRVPFNDQRVRQAVAMSINRNDIIDAAVEGLGRPGASPIPPGVQGFPADQQPLPHNINAAMAKLQSAGLATGFETTIHSFGGNTANIIKAEYLQSALKGLGIISNIQIHEQGAFFDMVSTGAYDGIIIASWTTVSWDADYSLYPLFHSGQMGDPGNRTFFSDPKIDALLERARQNPVQQERNALYAEASRLLIEKAPIIVTYYTVSPFITRDIYGVIIYNGVLPYFHSVVLN